MRMKHFKLVLVLDTTYEYNKINMIQSMQPKLGYFKPDILIGMVAEKALESEYGISMVRYRYTTKHNDIHSFDRVTSNPAVNSYLKDLKDRVTGTIIDYIPRIPESGIYGYVDADKTTITITIEDEKL